MDHLTRAFYEMKFRLDYVEKRGEAFQDWFGSIMEKCHPADFLRIRPWGNIGDRKNDGYLRSERTLFQVYAPNEMTAAAALMKIDEDFNGALPYWRDYFDLWVFAHNSREGLGPDVGAKLLALAREHTPLRVTSWGYEELRQRAFSLTEDDLASLLGRAPTTANLSRLGFEDLRVLLQHLARSPMPIQQDLRPVPPDKMEANSLSNNARTLLEGGMKRVDLVGRFFHRWPDPTYGDSMAEAFRREYLGAKGRGLSSDDIFQALHVFAGGLDRRGPDHEAAVLAVLAYFFEQCDIFERPLAGVAV